MNGVNVLFVISCIFIPLLLISMNYSAISDFYTYSVPLNSFVIESNFLFEEDRFQNTYQDKGLTVFYYSQHESFLL